MEESVSNITDATPHSETLPAMVDPPKMPHPQANPCSGCPRYKPEAVIRYGSITINQESLQVTWRGSALPTTMTRCEFRVLTLLVTHQGYAVRYRAIYDVIQRPGFMAGQTAPGFDQGFHTNVRSCIKRMRRKFLAIDPTFRNIVNHIGVGYSWSMD
jgi:two-component system response regulator ChvI